MKLRAPPSFPAFAAILFILLVAPAVRAVNTPQSSTNAPVHLSVPAPKPAKSVWLSREASDVLKLVRGQVKEDVVMAFVVNSRAGFSLSADEIVHLHNEGVSDHIISAMLARPKPAPTVAVPSPAPTVVQQQQPVMMQQLQPTVTYVQSPPVYVPAPAPVTYVYRPLSYRHYDPFPYSWSYPRYHYPRISFNFGYRSGFHGHHFHRHHGHSGRFHRGFYHRHC